MRAPHGSAAALSVRGHVARPLYQGRRRPFLVLGGLVSAGTALEPAQAGRTAEAIFDLVSDAPRFSVVFHGPRMDDGSPGLRFGLAHH